MRCLQARASMGPQLYRCGNLAKCTPCKVFLSALQWGRNFIVAEIEEHAGVLAAGGGASMGPQLYRCGNQAKGNEVQRRMTLLQWGRNFIVAEIRGLCLHRRASACFNGAATLSLRKLPKKALSEFQGYVLQWGRNFIVAEMYQYPLLSVVSQSLQWGRNFIVAEITIRS